MKKTALSLAIALTSALSSLASTTDTISVPTDLLERPMDVVVVTPDEANARNSKTFSTVYLLNGFGGCHKDWTKDFPRLGELADLYGMILVMPDGRDSWYWDAPNNPKMQMETFITTELVPYIDQKYPTKATPEFRAITGLSMGGHGALWLAIRHDDIFGSAGSMSGGVNILPFRKNWKMAEWLGPYEENKELWHKMTVAALVPELEHKNLNIIFDCGIDDFFAGINQELHEELVKRKIPHDYTSRPGNHSWKYWRNSILYHLLFFNEQFTNAAE